MSENTTTKTETVRINQGMTPKQEEAAVHLENMQDNVAHFAKEMRSEIKKNHTGEYTVPAWAVKSLDEVLKNWSDAGEAFIQALRKPE